MNEHQSLVERTGLRLLHRHTMSTKEREGWSIF